MSDYTREALAAMLQHSDPNGSYTDQALADEGSRPATQEELLSAIVDGPEGMPVDEFISLQLRIAAERCIPNVFDENFDPVEDEDGSPKMVEVVNVFHRLLELVVPADEFSDHCDYCLKALTEEAVSSGWGSWLKGIEPTDEDKRFTDWVDAVYYYSATRNGETACGVKHVTALLDHVARQYNYRADFSQTGGGCHTIILTRLPSESRGAGDEPVLYVGPTDDNGSVFEEDDWHSLARFGDKWDRFSAYDDESADPVHDQYILDGNYYDDTRKRLEMTVAGAFGVVELVRWVGEWLEHNVHRTGWHRP